MLVIAVTFISLALVFYTIGVWGERLQKELKVWHLAMFGAGLLFDTLGTTTMSKLVAGGFKLNFHGITGLVAIVLMLFHAIWATVVIMSNNVNTKKKFHKFSTIVWLIWLIPFASGAIWGMSR
ncbi:HsmA family protein [Mesoaciditoga lauensis]|uniref:HsmA family protein n=1 Tax=Mesoaciditoga lauensis TaxID=1495039 RepID=UPI0005680868|nr:HsmA family protein [Mesoaciditoga lauensis]